MVTFNHKPILHGHPHQLLQQHGCPTCRLRSYLLVTVEKENSRISINLFYKRFRNRQTNVSGISSSARVLRKRRNLVSMRFNMINWLLETVSLVLVMFVEKQILTILYLLVTSCGTPLVYYLGIEENRQKAREYFQSRMRIFKIDQHAAITMNNKIKPT